MLRWPPRCTRRRLRSCARRRRRDHPSGDAGPGADQCGGDLGHPALGDREPDHAGRGPGRDDPEVDDVRYPDLGASSPASSSRSGCCCTGSPATCGRCSSSSTSSGSTRTPPRARLPAAAPAGEVGRSLAPKVGQKPVNPKGKPARARHARPSPRTARPTRRPQNPAADALSQPAAGPTGQPDAPSGRQPARQQALAEQEAPLTQLGLASSRSFDTRTAYPCTDKES